MIGNDNLAGQTGIVATCGKPEGLSESWASARRRSCRSAAQVNRTRVVCRLRAVAALAAFGAASARASLHNVLLCKADPAGLRQAEAGGWRCKAPKGSSLRQQAKRQGLIIENYQTATIAIIVTARGRRDNCRSGLPGAWFRDSGTRHYSAARSLPELMLTRGQTAKPAGQPPVFSSEEFGAALGGRGNLNGVKRGVR